DRALDIGMNFDGSSITGFNAIEESDLTAKPDLSTFSLIPTGDGEFRTARLFADVVNPDGTVFSHDPRHILRSQVEKAAKLGFTYYVGPELEFFVFKSMELPPQPLDSGTYFTSPPVDMSSTLRTEIMTHLNAMGIQVEYHHHEVAPSQHEIDLRFTDALRMADSAITYKYIAKQVAHRRGCYITFMPKPLFGVNGSGMHIHQSLFKDGENAFYEPEDKFKLSATAKNFIAGLLKYAREITGFLAQYVNSYKRLIPGYEAPVYISWSPVNRSALVRVPAFVPGKASSVRCELRCADPACNFYFVFALMLAAGLKGIEDELELESPVLENLYELSELEREKRGIKSLPSNLHEALHSIKRSEFVREVLGDELTEQFLELKYREWADYQMHVSEWELKRYFSVL
ncbi:MAG: glutamine synthetase, partial [Candidatus Riflebacteria bacterium RBG_13_59_9]